MKTRPNLLLLSFFIMFSIILSIPLQILIQTEVTAVNPIILIQQISFLNWAVVLLCITTMVLSFNGNKLLKISVYSLLFSIHLNNFFVFKYAIYTEWYLPVIASGVATIAALIFLNNESINFITKNPDKRWWLIPIRYQKTLPVWIELDDKNCILANTYDLSKTGAFISTTINSEKDLEKKLELGKEFRILIGEKKNIEFHCNASVIRKTKGKGNYPSGIGLQFEDISLLEKYNLSRILNNPTLGL